MIKTLLGLCILILFICSFWMTEDLFGSANSYPEPPKIVRIIGIIGITMLAIIIILTLSYGAGELLFYIIDNYF